MPGVSPKNARELDMRAGRDAKSGQQRGDGALGRGCGLDGPQIMQNARRLPMI